MLADAISSWVPGPLLLGQSGSISAGEIVRDADLLSRPEQLLDLLMKLPAIVAVVVMVVGGVSLMKGYRWHRLIVIILAAMLGLGIGYLVSQQVARSAVVAISMGLLFAAIASPMLKYTVAVFAGLAGAFLGANIWSIVQGAESGSPWPGAAMGFILLALSSFLIFRIAIILFTSLGGAAMLVIGAIGCLLHVDAIQGPVREHLAQHHLIVPLLVGTAALAGFILQESSTRGGDGAAESE
jgi:hypothetical protein